MEQEIVAQFTSSAAVVWLIQELKHADWFNLIRVGSAKTTRLISILAALASGAAIKWNWNAETATITISGLTTWAILTFLWNGLQQFIGQEMLYQAIYAPKYALRQAASDVMVQTSYEADKMATKVADAVKENKDERQANY